MRSEEDIRLAIIWRNVLNALHKEAGQLHAFAGSECNEDYTTLEIKDHIAKCVPTILDKLEKLGDLRDKISSIIA
jgi:hypothetical protein